MLQFGAKLREQPPGAGTTSPSSRRSSGCGRADGAPWHAEIQWPPARSWRSCTCAEMEHGGAAHPRGRRSDRQAHRGRPQDRDLATACPTIAHILDFLPTASAPADAPRPRWSTASSPDEGRRHRGRRRRRRGSTTGRRRRRRRRRKALTVEASKSRRSHAIVKVRLAARQLRQDAAAFDKDGYRQSDRKKARKSSAREMTIRFPPDDHEKFLCGILRSHGRRRCAATSADAARSWSQVRHARLGTSSKDLPAQEQT